MKGHALHHETAPSGEWGWCSCRDWSTGPRSTLREVKGDHRAHLRLVVVTRDPDPFDLDRDLAVEWDSYEALTREEVMSCR